MYNGNVSSIHKNIKKDRGTKNEFHWRIFCKTLIRQHSCTTHCVQTVPVLAAILQKILWNSIISYLYLFYVFMNTWRHSRIKLRIFKRKGVYVRRYWFSIFVVTDSVYYKYQYSKTYTLFDGLNRLQVYVTEIKEKQITISCLTVSVFYLYPHWQLQHPQHLQH